MDKRLMRFGDVVLIAFAGFMTVIAASRHDLGWMLYFGALTTLGFFGLVVLHKLEDEDGPKQ